MCAVSTRMLDFHSILIGRCFTYLSERQSHTHASRNASPSIVITDTDHQPCKRMDEPRANPSLDGRSVGDIINYTCIDNIIMLLIGKVLV